MASATLSSTGNNGPSSVGSGNASGALANSSSDTSSSTVPSATPAPSSSAPASINAISHSSAPSISVGQNAISQGPMVPDPAELAAVATEESRMQLELKLKELIECLLELSITVYDFQPESNPLVHQKIQELISQLSEVDSYKEKLMDMMIPMEVLGYIEDGKNPDLFTKSFVECVAGENQFTNGKISAMKSFEDALAQQLGSFFPEEMMEYQKAIQESTSPSQDHGDTSATIKEEFAQPSNTSLSSSGSSSLSPSS